MAGKDIGQVLNGILQDSQRIAIQAVKSAANKAKDDVIEEAKTYLQEYYGNYAPKVYKRTYQLKNAIKPYFSDKSTASHVSIEVGVEYDAGALKYYSNSKYHQSGSEWKPVTNYAEFTSDNGIPEPEWVLNNFLHGIHPWAQQDSNATYTLMEEFLENELPNRIDAYIQSAFFNAITSRL